MRRLPTRASWPGSASFSLEANVLRFKLDENLALAAGSLLSAAGHDAQTVRSQALAGAPDADILQACLVEDRILITLDLDFSDIRSYPPESTYGLVVLWLTSHSKARILEVVSRLAPIFEHQSPAHSLWIVEENRVRIRSSPDQLDR